MKTEEQEGKLLDGGPEKAEMTEGLKRSGLLGKARLFAESKGSEA